MEFIIPSILVVVFSAISWLVYTKHVKLYNLVDASYDDVKSKIESLETDMKDKLQSIEQKLVSDFETEKQKIIDDCNKQIDTLLEEIKSSLLKLGIKVDNDKLI
ncbi:hypothetical protein [Gluconacetobacter diazotrophicus]|uniref:hypothetical protein n=1 Tax=Gluconacetobacter diazotrophicus TaxID=33996 RepID=UPI001199D2EA|nr:hypothetical protein [Gluconacetobacter diazotrophicus]TWB09340.1 hypothetical protein FBZ86_1042 [Gluconacetobacter diazotrophicus]